MHQRSPFRRAGAFAVLSAIVAGALAMMPNGAGAAEEEFIAGSGGAQARIVRAGPAAGQLALAPTVGLSLADYLNTSGRGDARALEFGALELAIPQQVKDAAPAVRVTSSDEASEGGKDSSFAGAPAGGPVAIGVIQQHADASKAPVGHSVVTLAGFSLPGAVSMSGGIAETTAGVVKPGLREAHATTRIGRIDLGGGVVTLTGLKWDTVQRTGSESIQTGTFSIEGIQVGGQAIAPPPLDQLDAIFAGLNSALAPSGLVLDLPRFTKDGGIAAMSPLAVRIVNSQVGNTLLAPVVGAIQPIREPVTSGLLGLPALPPPLPALSTAVLLADVLAGVATGSGRFDVELGGVSGYTEGTRYEGYNFDFTASLGDSGASNDLASGSFGSGAGSSLLPAGGLSSGFSPSGGLSSSTAGAAGAPSVGSGRSRAGSGQAIAAASSPPIRHLGAKDGAAVIVGLVGLLGAVGLAGADWRIMRAGRRTIAV